MSYIQQAILHTYDKILSNKRSHAH